MLCTTGPVSMDLQLQLVSGWGLQNQRSAPSYRPLWLRNDFSIVLGRKFKDGGGGGSIMKTVIDWSPNKCQSTEGKNPERHKTVFYTPHCPSLTYSKNSVQRSITGGNPSVYLSSAAWNMLSKYKNKLLSVYIHNSFQYTYYTFPVALTILSFVVKVEGKDDADWAKGRYCHVMMYKLLYPSIRIRTAPLVSVRVRISVSFTV